MLIMTTTVNISLPQEMYKDAKKAVKERRYSSVSELVRDALRRTIYQEDEMTENGFPRWLEDKALAAEASPMENDTVIETDEDLEKYFQEMHARVKKKRNGQIKQQFVSWQ